MTKGEGSASMGDWLVAERIAGRTPAAEQSRVYPSLVTAAEVSVTLPFVIPSEAEGPAVHLFMPRQSSLRRDLRTPCKHDCVRGDDPLTFLHGDGLVGLNIWYNVLMAAGPHDGEPHSSAWVRLAQAEGHR